MGFLLLVHWPGTSEDTNVSFQLQDEVVQFLPLITELTVALLQVVHAQSDLLGRPTQRWEGVGNATQLGLAIALDLLLGCLEAGNLALELSQGLREVLGEPLGGG